ncbi:MAG TPA: DsrE family protein [Methylibium sp.]
MKRRNLLQTTLLAAGAAAAAQTADAQGSSAKHRVVFQVSDGDSAKWNLALGNIRNMQDGVGADHVEIELVAYGPGIAMLKRDATTSDKVAEAVKSGVKVVGCQNTMRAYKLASEDMNPAIGYVPSGVVELMTKQGEGWAYLRP